MSILAEMAIYALLKELFAMRRKYGTGPKN